MNASGNDGEAGPSASRPTPPFSKWAMRIDFSFNGLWARASALHIRSGQSDDFVMT
jgi:hypothetical protein